MSDKNNLINSINTNNEKIVELINKNNMLLKENADILELQFNKHNSSGKYLIAESELSRVKFINDSYNLDTLIYDYKTRANVKYLIQLDELWEFFKTKFYMFGQVLSSFIHYQILNWATIAEAVLYDALARKNNYCNICKKETTCINKISSKKKFADVINSMVELNYIILEDETIKTLNFGWDLRNNVHLRKMDKTIYNNYSLNETSLNLIKKAVLKLFETLKNDLIPIIDCKNLEKVDLLTYNQFYDEVKNNVINFNRSQFDSFNKNHIHVSKNYAIQDKKYLYKKQAVEKMIDLFKNI